MNKLVVYGVVFVLALAGLTWFFAGDKMGDDVVNQLAMLGAVAILAIAVFVVIKYVRQMQNDTASGTLSEESWGGIREYNNELPMGWAISFVALIIYFIWYALVGFPLNSYSQIGEYNKESSEYDKKFVEKFKNLDEKTLIEMGEASFMVNCAPCHGLQADGMDSKAADLHQRLSEKSVKHVLINGSNNNLLGIGMPMPDRNGLLNAATNALITDAEIDTVTKYVAGGMKGTAGADVFAGTCAACHGADGKGMDMVAPNIAQMSPVLVDQVIRHGKKGAIGAMPAFKNFNEVQYKALEAYVSSLSKSKE